VGLTRLVFAIRRGDEASRAAALEEATTQGAIGGRGIRGGYLEVGLAELAWLAGDDRAAIDHLDHIDLSPGIWNREMGAWQARWRARLAPAAVDPEDVRSRLRDCPDLEAGGAMLAEVDAEFGERRERVGRRRPLDGSRGAWRSPAAIRRRRGTLRQAEAGFRSADREAARGALHAASATFSELGALPMLRRAEDLARRARVAAHEPQRRRAEPDELTEREREVLALVAEGLTNPQIADRLFLSRNTVGIHVSRILDKLGAKTRGRPLPQRRRGIVAWITGGAERAPRLAI
jgi:DNA-binding CsgD family transcriptional regulator